MLTHSLSILAHNRLRPPRNPAYVLPARTVAAQTLTAAMVELPAVHAAQRKLFPDHIIVDYPPLGFPPSGPPPEYQI